MSDDRRRREVMPVSPIDQPPLDDIGDVDFAVIVGLATVLAPLIYVSMAVVALGSVTAFVLALPFFLFDERRHRRTMDHPLWDSGLDSLHESGVGSEVEPKGIDQAGSAS